MVPFEIKNCRCFLGGVSRSLSLAGTVKLKGFLAATSICYCLLFWKMSHETARDLLQVERLVLD